MPAASQGGVVGARGLKVVEGWRGWGAGRGTGNPPTFLFFQSQQRVVAGPHTLPGTGGSNQLSHTLAL